MIPRPGLVRDERGSTLVEFALVSPIVVLLIMTALQFGLALRANAGLRDLAGFAGREAVVSFQRATISDGTGINASQLKTLIEDEAESARYNLSDEALTVQVSATADTTLLTVNRVRVQLAYDYPISVPFLPTTSIPLVVDRTFFVPN